MAVAVPLLSRRALFLSSLLAAGPAVALGDGPAAAASPQIGFALLSLLLGLLMLFALALWSQQRHERAWLFFAVGLGALLLHSLDSLRQVALDAPAAVWAGWALLLLAATLLISGGLLLWARNRLARALREAADAQLALKLRLAEREAVLQAQHQRLRESERQQALMAERQRLMQDMHDGLGSALLSAMVAVEQGAMDRHAVVDVLRECVDDLRLVIDSLEPVGHDLVALLATMRYRLGKRLQAGGLVLDWDVQDLPTLEWLEPPDALQVLRLMQEALSNVLKHAKASRVRLATRRHERYVEIRIEDDGEGFDIASAPRGRGLRSQQRRAQRLGGSLDLDSTPGHGTRLCLRLPITRSLVPVQQDEP